MLFIPVMNGQKNIKNDNFMFENTKVRTICAGSSDKRISKGDFAAINSLSSV